MIHHLKVEHNELTMYAINPKSSTKLTERRFIANKPTNETKFTHKETQLILKKAENVSKGNKELVRQIGSK